jgi:hypothetical protein
MGALAGRGRERSADVNARNFTCMSLFFFTQTTFVTGERRPLNPLYSSDACVRFRSDGRAELEFVR